jgi:hypothetical protein
MGFDPYDADAQTLEDTIEDTKDLTVTNSGSTLAVSVPCDNYSTCTPQPSDVTITATTVAVGASSAVWQQEVLTWGGSPAWGALTYTPISDDAVVIAVDGIVQRLTTDYTRDGKNIRFVVSPTAGSTVLAYYITGDTVP